MDAVGRTDALGGTRKWQVHDRLHLGGVDHDGKSRANSTGEPHAIIVVATEDSWSHTIVPRLMAAGENPKLIYRVDVITADGLDGTLSLPADVKALEHAVEEVKAVLVLLDPMLSRLSNALDTHKDAEVRIALEPTVAFTKRSGVAVLGIIHVNKGSSVDPLTLVMGSRAFVAVGEQCWWRSRTPRTRAAFCWGWKSRTLAQRGYPPSFTGLSASWWPRPTRDPSIPAKSNGWRDQPVSVRGHGSRRGGPGAASATSECAEWLYDYLGSNGGGMDSAAVKEAATRRTFRLCHASRSEAPGGS